MKTAEAKLDTGLLQKLKQNLAANRPKAIVLGVLVLVLIGALIRLLVGGSSPEPASAELPLAVAGPSGSPPQPLARPVPQPLAAATEGGAPAKTAPPNRQTNEHGGSNQAAQAGTHKSMRAVSVKDLPRTLERDVFNSANWAAFQPDIVPPSAAEAAAAAQPAASIWTQMREAMAEQSERLAQRREGLAGELAGLQLQSTMTGPAPAAYISGRLVRLGETIKGFSVVAIGDKIVKLRKDGLTFSLTMP